MKIIKYFFEFNIIISLFCLFKLLGLKNASHIGGFLGKLVGPFFRSKTIIKAFLGNVYDKNSLRVFDFKNKNSGEIEDFLNVGSLFVEKEVEERKLNDTTRDELKTMLISACRSNKLSKNTEIIYDREKCLIEKIKILKYENQKYSLQTTETKKSKSSTKSRSNIERLIRNA